MPRLSFLLIVLTAGLAGCGSPASTTVQQYGYQIIHAYPHDPDAFTEGLEFHDGYLYESTGLKGKSSIRKVTLESGAVVQKFSLPQEYFGEGITLEGDKLIQLEYQGGKGFVYDLAGFQTLRTFNYSGEGWALTHTGDRIYMSDGTPEIRVWDGTTLAEKSRFTVMEGDRPLSQINELEWIKGEIWANVWQSDRIVRINPADGKVVGSIDMSALLTPEERAKTDVLNGIAYDAAGDRIFVTGKLWPKLFEIRVVKR